MANVNDGKTIVVNLPIPPLRYHLDLVGHLRLHEGELWKWFMADGARAKNNEAVRLELLKSTYRIERESSPEVYALLDKTANALMISAPITLYQSSGGGMLNAALAYTPGEGHIIFSGPLLTTLTPAELQCVLAHELMHFVLLDRWKDHLIASDLLAALCNDANAQPSHHASARLLRLYTEVLCDRAAYFVTKDLVSVITTLVRIETGIAEASAESYLRQTEEIFEKGHPVAEGVTHPEAFIRAKAIQLWSSNAKDADGELEKVIEGPMSIENLDLLGQQRIRGLTRRLISQFLKPHWLRTEAMVASAKLFFEDFAPGDLEDGALREELSAMGEKLVDYYCYVLLDFATADRDLEEAPLAAALLLSDELNLGERFREIAGKELNLKKKQLQSLEANASSIVNKASEGAE